MASIIKSNPYKNASFEGLFSLDVVKFLKSEKGKKQILKDKSSSIYKNLTKKCPCHGACCAAIINEEKYECQDGTIQSTK